MKLYPKIDLYFNGDYICSTNQARTCKEARGNYLDMLKRYSTPSITSSRILKRPDLLKARFAQPRGLR